MTPSTPHSLTEFLTGHHRRGADSRSDERHRARKRPGRGKGAARGVRGLEGRALARRISQVALARKAEDVVIFDLRGISSETDFFVIMSSVSETHQKALADHLSQSLFDVGIKAWHLEGYPSSNWILIDYVDVVVHIFRPEARDFYALEILWGDAPRETIEDGSDSPADREG